MQTTRFLFLFDIDNTPYEKVGNAEPVSIADEVPFDIPNFWEWVRLSTISILNGGFAFKSSEYKAEGVRVIGISDLTIMGCFILSSNTMKKKYSFHYCVLNLLIIPVGSIAFFDIGWNVNPDIL